MSEKEKATVFLKLKDERGLIQALPYRDDTPINTDLEKVREERGLKLVGLEDLAHQEIKPVYSNIEKLITMIKEAEEKDPTYKSDMLSFYKIECKTLADAREILKMVLQWEIVEQAYIPLARPAQVNPTSNCRYSEQIYLKSAPIGIGAQDLWGKNGADGEFVTLIDVEHGWVDNHVDLPSAKFVIKDGVNCNSIGYRSHGTAVLGVICAVDNGIGCMGLVQNIKKVYLVSPGYGQGNYGDTIKEAQALLDDGEGVLLLELDVCIDRGEGLEVGLPCEALPDCWSAIRLATARKITVVEAAGNGPNNLDDWVDGIGKRVFNKYRPSEFKDSLAIIVGASQPDLLDVTHPKRSGTNWGNRIDCFAWGDEVVTCWSKNNDPGGYTINDYTNSFSDTSAATAIIAGVTVLVQNMIFKKTGSWYEPREIRKVLSDCRNGTSNTGTEYIGIMPDLKKIWENVINI